MSRVSLLSSLTNSVSLEALIIEVHFTLTPVASTLSKRDVCVLIWVNESLVRMQYSGLKCLSVVATFRYFRLEYRKKNVLHECTA